MTSSQQAYGRRASELDDKDAMFAIRAAWLRDVVEGWHEDNERAAWGAAFQAGDHVVLVDDRAHVAAFMRVERKRHEIHVAELYVAAEHGRHGIAARLLRELIDEAVRADVPVSMHIPPRAQPAIALLRKLGFVPVPSKEPARSRFVWRVA